MQNNQYLNLQNVIIGGLKSTQRILDKADSFIKEEKITENDLLSASIAPDMYNFTKQIQVVSDSAKSAMAKLAGVVAPSMPDTETTMAELHSRIEKTLEYVKTFNEESFKDADNVQIKFAWMPTKYIKSEDFVNDFAIQNYMFHITIAYAILRMKGVNIGKMDFIGNVDMHDVK